MYVIRATAFDKKNLPEMMLHALKKACELGDLDGLIHAKDDTTRELQYGWEMISYWDTPKEVAKL